MGSDISIPDSHIRSLGHLYPLYLGSGWWKRCGHGLGLLSDYLPAFCTGDTAGLYLDGLYSNRAVHGILVRLGMVLPMVVWYNTHSAVPTLCAYLIAGLIIFRHKDNIIRLIHGTESTICGKSEQVISRYPLSKNRDAF